MKIIDADEFKEQLKQRYLNAVEWRSKTVYYEKADGEIAAFLEAIRTLNNAPAVDAVPREELLNILNGRLDFLQKWRNETADFKNIATAMIEDCEDIIDIIKSLKEKTDERTFN